MLEIFVDYFRLGESPPATFWQQISDSQLNLLVEELSFPIDDSQQPILSLRVLLSCSRIRKRTVLRTIELLQMGICERTALQIISELNFSIVDYFNIACESNEDVRLFLEQVLLKIFLPCQETRNPDIVKLKGCAHAIEIVPTLLDCIPRYGADKGISSLRVFTISTILSSPWPSSLIVPLLKIFLESDLCQKEQKQVNSKISSILGSIDTENVIATIATSLALAEKYEEPQWFEVVRRLIDSAPEAILSDLFCVIEISFQTSPKLVSLVTSTLRNQRLSESSKSVHSSKMSTQNQMTSSDYVLFLLAAQNDLYKDLVIQSLVEHIMQNFQLNNSRLTSPANDVMSECKELLSKVVLRAEAASMTGLLLELALSMLQASEINKSGVSLGEYLVTLLYMCQPHARSAALKMTFDALVENTHKINMQIPFIRILQTICSQYLISLREHTQVVLHGISSLWLLQLPMARKILSILLPLSSHSSPIRERLLVLVRKELFSTESQRRRLAVSAVCGLLQCRALGGDDEIDLLVTLRPMLSGDSRIANDAYCALQHLIRHMCLNGQANRVEDAQNNTNSVIEEVHLSPEAKDFIKETVSKRFQRLLEQVSRADALVPAKSYLTADCGRHCGTAGFEKETARAVVCNAVVPCMRVNLEKCFEMSRLDGKIQVRCKEQLAGLVRCLATFPEAESWAMEDLGLVARQLACPTTLAAMLCRGIDHNADNLQAALASIRQRACALLQVLDVIIDVASGGDPPRWAWPEVYLCSSGTATSCALHGDWMPPAASEWANLKRHARAAVHDAAMRRQRGLWWMCLYSALTAVCVPSRVQTECVVAEVGTGDNCYGSATSKTGCGALETLESVCGLSEEEDLAARHSVAQDGTCTSSAGGCPLTSHRWSEGLHSTCSSIAFEPFQPFEVLLTAPALISTLVRALDRLERLPSTNSSESDLSSLTRMVRREMGGAGQSKEGQSSSGPRSGFDSSHPMSHQGRNGSLESYGGQTMPIVREGKEDQRSVTLRLLACSLHLYLITAPQADAGPSARASTHDCETGDCSDDCETSLGQMPSIWAQLSLEMRKTFAAVMRIGEASGQVTHSDKSRVVGEKRRLRRYVLSAVTRCLHALDKDGLRGTVSRNIESLRKKSKTTLADHEADWSDVRRCKAHNCHAAPEIGQSSDIGAQKSKQRATSIAVVDMTTEQNIDEFDCGDSEIGEICLGEVLGQLNAETRSVQCCVATLQAHLDLLHALIQQPLPRTLATDVAHQVIGAFVASPISHKGHKHGVSKPSNAPESKLAGNPQVMKRLLNIVELALTAVPMELEKVCVAGLYAAVDALECLRPDSDPARISLSSVWTFPPLHLPTARNLALGWCLRLLFGSFPENRGPDNREACKGGQAKTIVEADVEGDAETQRYSLSDLSRRAQVAQAVATLVSAAAMAGSRDAAEDSSDEPYEDSDCSQEADTCQRKFRSSTKSCRSGSNKLPNQGISKSAWRLLGKLVMQILEFTTHATQCLHITLDLDYATQCIHSASSDRTRKGQLHEIGSDYCIRGSKTKKKRTSHIPEAEIEQRKQKLIFICKEAMSAAVGLRQAGNSWGGLVECAADEAAAALCELCGWVDGGIPGWMQDLQEVLHDSNHDDTLRVLALEEAAANAGRLPLQIRPGSSYLRLERQNSGGQESAQPALGPRGGESMQAAVGRAGAPWLANSDQAYSAVEARNGTSHLMAAGAVQVAGRRGVGRKRVKVSSGNAYVRACLLSEGAEDSDDFSDLEDFIECNPGKRY